MKTIFGVILCFWVASANSKQAVQGQQAEANATHFLTLRTGTQDPARLPISWTADSVSWRISLPGVGQSTPLFWERQVYVTSVAGTEKNQCVISCINADSGEVLWEKSFDSSFPEPSSPMVSHAAPSPVCDASGLYTLFESGDLLALNHSGGQIWQRSLQRDFGNFENKFGISSSLAQTESRIFVLIDHQGDAFVLAIDKRSGKDLWKTPRPNRGHSWSSPAIIEVGGRPIVVCSSIGSVDAYDPETGELLCHFDQVGGNSVATPIDQGDGTFLVASLIRPVDGPVQNALSSNCLLQLSELDGVFEINVKWIAENARGSFCSPIRHGNECYWINPVGVLYCLDAESGEQLYSQRLPCGGVWATPVATLDRIYCFGKDGKTTVVKAGRIYEELASENSVFQAGQSVASQPSSDDAVSKDDISTSAPGIYAALIVDNHIFIRQGGYLYRLN